MLIPICGPWSPPELVLYENTPVPNLYVFKFSSKMHH